jgi:hypothetical protein
VRWRRSAKDVTAACGFAETFDHVRHVAERSGLAAVGMGEVGKLFQQIFYSIGGAVLISITFFAVVGYVRSRRLRQTGA